MQFLVVDDTQFMRNLICKTLKNQYDCECIEADDGERAIQIAMKHEFTAILMDWNMPVPGIHAVKMIRKGGITTPILMVTTEGEKHKVIEAIQSGANNYLVKPFKSEQLIDKVEKILPRS